MRPTRPIPDLEGAEQLAASMRERSVGRTAGEVAALLESWGWPPPTPTNPADPNGYQLFLYSQPGFYHLQMQCPKTGPVHSAIVDLALGLVDSLRAHL